MALLQRGCSHMQVHHNSLLIPKCLPALPRHGAKPLCTLPPGRLHRQNNPQYTPGPHALLAIASSSDRCSACDELQLPPAAGSDALQPATPTNRLARKAVLLLGSVGLVFAVMGTGRAHAAQTRTPLNAHAVWAATASSPQDATIAGAIDASDATSTSSPAASSNTGPTSSPAASTSGRGSGSDALLPAERATMALFDANVPSVVNISPVRAMQHFHTMDIRRLPYGQGSGFVWDRAGHIVTNYHLVKGAAEVKVTLHDHTTITARVVGHDAAKDLAVLKLALPKHKAEQLRPAVLGDSDALRIGMGVHAIGNPFGLSDHTLSSGVVSGLDRELSAGLFAIRGVIATDAAINGGNSGGMLVSSSGAVVGQCVALSDSSSSTGLGYAVPINSVKGLVDQILRHGKVLRPGMGFSVAPAQVLERLGVEGVLVLEVPAGSPAAQAGLRPTYRDVFGDILLGDIIIMLDLRPVRRYSDLVSLLDDKRVGDKVRCDVLRDGKRLSLTVELGERTMGCD